MVHCAITYLNTYRLLRTKIAILIKKPTFQIDIGHCSRASLKDIKGLVFPISDRILEKEHTGCD